MTEIEETRGKKNAVDKVSGDKNLALWGEAKIQQDSSTTKLRLDGSQ